MREAARAVGGASIVIEVLKAWRLGRACMSNVRNGHSGRVERMD